MKYIVALLFILTSNLSLSGETTLSKLQELPNGFHLISSSSSSADTFVFIIGINDDGGSWKDAINLTERAGNYNIYLYKWDKWQSPSGLSSTLALNLNKVQLTHKDATTISVVGHSTGGILLLDALTEQKSNSQVLFESTHPDIRFYTVASPLGGYHNSGAKYVGVFIGAVTAKVGGYIRYKSINNSVQLTILKTSFENDIVLKEKNDYDMRIPEIDNAFSYREYLLESSTHNGSVYDSLEIILGGDI